jgi:hypothetical protein
MKSIDSLYPTRVADCREWRPGQRRHIGLAILAALETVSLCAKTAVGMKPLFRVVALSVQS